ncbi:tyrosine-type recombinase/integrase [Planktotalea lamellibrachiae]|nr:tyrosine-type recombinase/integrase [Aliiroseovarius lamellibrachiae]
MSIPHLRKENRSGVYRYRRRVPEDLRLAIGKTFLDRSLETKDENVAIQKRHVVHQEVERLFAELRKGGPDRLEYETSVTALKNLGLWGEGQSAQGPILWETAPAPVFQKMTDAILAENDPKKQDMLLKAKFAGVKPPDVRLDQAVEIYLDERAGDNFPNLKKQTELAARVLCEVLGDQNPKLAEVTFKDAYKLRDSLLHQGKAPDTVKKRIGSLRAVYNVARRRLNQPNLLNPFESVSLPKAQRGGPAKEKREALTVDEIRKCTVEIARSNDEIKALWTLLVFTGARPSELCRLRWSDVFLDAEVPHIRINAERGRPIKTEGSERSVPLVGDGYGVLKGRLGLTGGEGDVFPRYAALGGPGSASQLMVKAMKKAAVWVKLRKVPYSIRHSHKDWMRRVARKEMTDRIHGHGRKCASAEFLGPKAA